MEHIKNFYNFYKTAENTEKWKIIKYKIRRNNDLINIIEADNYKGIPKKNKTNKFGTSGIPLLNLNKADMLCYSNLCLYKDCDDCYLRDKHTYLLNTVNHNTLKDYKNRKKQQRENDQKQRELERLNK